MSTKMLIDARHREETRVVVLRGQKVEEFDYEAAAKRQLKGNIYLARVTRVEPSLQAAFVEYGGNRHGFLAFSEIHPDYYQIPIADREKILEEEAAELAADEDYNGADGEENAADKEGERAAKSEGGDGEGEALAATEEEERELDEVTEAAGSRRRRFRRRYKIQEVIKRRQVLLVQVVKEERGSKGAALTTYLSLAGRYCVLMPNSIHGGGISRKIANVKDRRRLKSIMSSLDVPETMGCIIRTAGLQRTKAEIKRDYDYLLRMWEEIRELTLNSVAPTLIYEEGDLIKRAIRDLYTRDIDEIKVEGEDGYRTAKNFMKMLMPSHAKKVQLYKDRIPLFQRYGVEAQLDTMFQPVVQLKSGGYIVINPTEALVSIDVNSGKATRQHNIEETALATNGEAAQEIARQLRLRDLAGLIVIDFIDMEDRGNNRTVERKLREALKTDRARVQIGRISSFGLLEMSRQRLRPGMLEASSHTCPLCEGAGTVRSVGSAALHAIRALEEEGLKSRGSEAHMELAPDVALYILNNKRSTLRQLEERYGYEIEIVPNDEILSPHYELDVTGPPPQAASAEDGESALSYEGVEADETEDKEERRETPKRDAKAQQDDEEKPKRRRRRRRRGGRKGEEAGEDAKAESASEDAEDKAEQAEEEKEAKPRRRTRRAGRGRRARADKQSEAKTDANGDGDGDGKKSDAEEVEEVKAEATETAEAPPAEKKRRRPSRRRKKAAEDAPAAEEKPAAANDDDVSEKSGNGSGSSPEPEPPAIGEGPEAEPAAAGEPPRRGWWQRAFNR